MKKIITLLLTFIMCIALSACGEDTSINENDIAGIFAVRTLQETLKNPHSIKLFSVTKKEDSSGNIIVKIEYSAENSLGGSVENDYYTVLTKPNYNQEEDVWSCGFEDGFNISVRLDDVNGALSSLQNNSGNSQSSAQKEAKRDYERIENEESLDVDKISNNLEYFTQIHNTTKSMNELRDAY